jgi:hypothetical protein
LLRFNDIADRALEVDPECDLELLQRAYVFSASCGSCDHDECILGARSQARACGTAR